MIKWHTQAPPVQLRENEVHLWIVSLTDASQQLSYFTSILSADEKERVRRFRKISDRKRYVVARGLLRRFLGCYGAGAPDRLQFTYNAFGKPSLFSAEPQTVLNFSVSHSEDQALFGFMRGRRIGVDLEYVRPDNNARHFTAHGLARRPISKLWAKGFHSVSTAWKSLFFHMNQPFSGRFPACPAVPKIGL